LMPLQRVQNKRMKLSNRSSYAILEQYLVYAMGIYIYHICQLKQ